MQSSLRPIIFRALQIKPPENNPPVPPMKREMQGYPARAGHSAVISVFSSAFAFGFSAY
jgi:hypothetical protein